MEIQPYLFFEGNCEAAIDFYKTALDANVTMMMRYEDSPEPGQIPPQSEKKIMHASFKVGPTTINASDGYCRGAAAFKGFGLSLYAPNEAEAHRLFAVLGEGGAVQMPMRTCFFSPAFGTVADKFGVTWMVMALPAEQASAAA